MRIKVPASGPWSRELRRITDEVYDMGLTLSSWVFHPEQDVFVAIVRDQQGLEIHL